MGCGCGNSTWTPTPPPGASQQAAEQETGPRGIDNPATFWSGPEPAAPAPEPEPVAAE